MLIITKSVPLVHASSIGPLPSCLLWKKKSPSVSFTFYIVHNNATPPPPHRKKRNFIEDVTYSAVRSAVFWCPPCPPRCERASTPVRLVFVPIPGRASSSSSHDMMIDDGRAGGRTEEASGRACC